jgi:hypothetical protein
VESEFEINHHGLKHRTFDLYCEGCIVVSRVPPPPWFELQMSRLPVPGKGGYSTRPPGTTSSLIIWVEVYVASVTYFPPTERGVNSPDWKVGEGSPPGEEEGAG